MSFFKKIEAFIFKENFSRIPLIFWLSPFLVVLLHVVLFIKHVPIAPYLLIYSIFALVISTRLQLKGLIGSVLGLIILSFLLKELIPLNHFSLYLSLLIALGSSYMIQAFISESYEEFLVLQAKEASFAKEDQKLWKSRFENAQFKFEKEKEFFEKTQTEFERSEDTFEETLESMKHLLAMSHRENQKLVSQNDRLIEENKEITAIKRAHFSLEEESKRLLNELNEARVQLYQDRLLYQSLREEKEKLEEEAKIRTEAEASAPIIPTLPLSTPIEVEQLEMVLEKTILAEAVTENIYTEIN